MTTVAPISTKGKGVNQPTRGQARYAFTILLIINILNYADRYVLPAILPKVQHDLGMNNTEAGLIGSSFLLVYAFATLPLGIWADRSVRKNIVAICVALWSVATALAGFTRSFIQLFSVRAILGIGEAGYAPASLSLLGDYFPKEQRGRILSYWSAGTLIGTALGYVLGGFAADAFGWRWAFFLVGIPGLLAAFLIWRVVEPKRGAFDDAEDGTDRALTGHEHVAIGKDFWNSARKLFTIPTYWVLLIALICSFFTIGGTSFWLPKYIGGTFHLSVSRAGTVSGLILVCGGLIGTVAGGWLADLVQRYRPEGRLLIAALGFLIGAPLVLFALLTQTLPLFIVEFIFAATFLSFCTGPLNAVIQDVITPEVRATAIGLSLLLAHLLGDAASPSI
ncbi:MAG: MFS transporter, partial [Chloroflexota bacterium]|nr:MFS transporter [Chloroflexota bacterium]